MFLGASSSSAWHPPSAFPSPTLDFWGKFHALLSAVAVVWGQEGRAHEERVFGIVCQGSCRSEYVCLPYLCFNCTNETCTFSCTLLAEFYQSLDQITDLSYPWTPRLVCFCCRGFWRTLGEWNYLESLSTVGYASVTERCRQTGTNLKSSQHCWKEGHRRHERNWTALLGQSYEKGCVTALKSGCAEHKLHVFEIIQTRIKNEN